MKKILFLLATTSCIFILFGCSKVKKEECKTAACKLLMNKTWKLDAEAVRTYALTKAGKTSGIKNLKDIKLKKDVKKIADFLQSKKIYFSHGSGKYKHRLVCSVTIGKSILKTKRTDYWKLSNNKKIMIDLYGKKEVEKISYKVIELKKDKLVILKEGSVVPEIYTSK